MVGRQGSEVQQAVGPRVQVQLFLHATPIVQIGVLVEVAVVDPAFRMLLDPDWVAHPAQGAGVERCATPASPTVYSSRIRCRFPASTTGHDSSLTEPCSGNPGGM